MDIILTIIIMSHDQWWPQDCCTLADLTYPLDTDLAYRVLGKLDLVESIPFQFPEQSSVVSL